MESLRDVVDVVRSESSIIPSLGIIQWPSWPIVVIIVLGVVLIAGYWFLPGPITGFKRHEGKTTTTYEYDGTGQGQPTKKTITRETEPARTFWDWLSIVTISAVLAIVAFSYTRSQAEQQRVIQDQEAKDTALQGYLDQMTQLMLVDQNSLLNSEPNSSVRGAARVQTVATLQRLDGQHNKIVLAFLRDSGLVDFTPGGQNESVVRLDQSNLNGVDFGKTIVGGASLRFTRLRNADLSDTNVAAANLSFADLARAKLKEADLGHAVLLFANLEGADLSGANFSNARLSGVDLSGANLKTAKHLTQYQINQAGAGDSETTLPDGLEAPAWWSKQNTFVRDRSVAVPKLQDSSLGASLVALKSIRSLELDDEIGIPKKVGSSEEGGTVGALVYDVEPGSPADAAGIAAGDVIVKVDQDSVRGLEDLQDALDQKKASSRLQILAWRYYFHEGWLRGDVNVKLGY